MKTILRKLVVEFKTGSSPMLGIWLLVIFGVVSTLILPWLFTRNWGLPSFNQTGSIGDTFNGIAGPFIALAAAILTFLAFWVQYQANQEQKRQFEKQNQDQVFFKIFESQETRLVNSSFTIDQQEVKSYQLLEKIVTGFREELDDQTLTLARQIFCEEPEIVSDLYLREMFALDMVLNNEVEKYLMENFKDLKEKFFKQMKEKDKNERWEFIKYNFGSARHENEAQKRLLNKIGSVYFYKISFAKRLESYRVAFDRIERKYGSFLDGYLRGWQFLALFIKKSLNKEIYIQYLSSQLSKFEIIILFYYIAGGYSDREFIKFIEENSLLQNLHYYNGYLIDAPLRQDLDSELLNIFSQK